MSSLFSLLIIGVSCVSVITVASSQLASMTLSSNYSPKVRSSFSSLQPVRMSRFGFEKSRYYEPDANRTSQVFERLRRAQVNSNSTVSLVPVRGARHSADYTPQFANFSIENGVGHDSPDASQPWPVHWIIGMWCTVFIPVIGVSVYVVHFHDS